MFLMSKMTRKYMKVFSIGRELPSSSELLTDNDPWGSGLAVKVATSKGSHLAHTCHLATAAWAAQESWTGNMTSFWREPQARGRRRALGAGLAQHGPQHALTVSSASTHPQPERPDPGHSAQGTSFLTLSVPCTCSTITGHVCDCPCSSEALKRDFPKSGPGHVSLGHSEPSWRSRTLSTRGVCPPEGISTLSLLEQRKLAAQMLHQRAAVRQQGPDTRATSAV